MTRRADSAVNSNPGQAVPERTETGESTPLRDELLALVKSWQVRLPSGFDDDSRLISSGCFDSLALFNLSIWIETKIGRTLDPGSVDIVERWDSVRSILHYVESQLRAPSGDASPSSRKLARPLGPAGYEIVRYDLNHKREVAELQRQLWNPDPELNLCYLEWKYERNPYCQSPNIYLAFHHAELVGMRGFYGSRWETGIPARQFDILVADDLLIREDHRNQALVTHIMQAAYEDLRGTDIPYLFNLSGGPLTVIGSFTTGWRSAGNLKPMRRTPPRRTIYSALWEKLSRRLRSRSPDLNPFSRLDAVRSPVDKYVDGVPVSIEKAPRPRAMAALIERIRHDGRLRHVRDEHYFNWRFQNPLHEYRFLFAGNDSLTGYLVLKTSRNLSNRWVSISDLEAEDDRVRSALLQTAVKAGVFSELLIWTAAASNELLKELHELDFSPIPDQQAGPRAPRILVRPVQDEGLERKWRLGDTELLDINNWDMRMLYSMAG